MGESSVRHRCWLSSCLSYSVRLLLYVPLSCKKPFLRQIRFSAVWHLAEQCLPWQGLSGSAHPGVFKNRWTQSQPSSFRIHGLKVHLQTDLSKSGQPCWLTNTLSLLIKTKLQITTVTKNSYPLLTFAERPKQNRINPKYRSTYVQLSHGSFISPICLRKHCISSLITVFSQKLLPFQSPKCSWALYIPLQLYLNKFGKLFFSFLFFK